MRYLILALLLASSAVADSVVVNPDGSATVTIALSAREYTLAQIAHEAYLFDDPRNAPTDLASVIAQWIRVQVVQWQHRAADLRRQRGVELPPAAELDAVKAALRPGR